MHTHYYTLGMQTKVLLHTRCMSKPSNFSQIILKEHHACARVPYSTQWIITNTHTNDYDDVICLKV